MVLHLLQSNGRIIYPVMYCTVYSWSTAYRLTQLHLSSFNYLIRICADCLSYMLMYVFDYTQNNMNMLLKLNGRTLFFMIFLLS